MASLAARQKSVKNSTRNAATNNHSSRPTRGTEIISPARSTSATTIVQRRSSCSASSPASGPKTTTGRSLATSTAPTAYAPDV